MRKIIKKRTIINSNIDNLLEEGFEETLTLFYIRQIYLFNFKTPFYPDILTGTADHNIKFPEFYLIFHMDI